MKKQSDIQIQNNVESNGELNFKADKTSSTFTTRAKKPVSMNLGSKIFASIIALVFITGVLFFAYRVIPDYIVANTDEIVEQKAREESESRSNSEAKSLEALIQEENSRLTFTDQKVAINFEEFGTVNISLRDKPAPKTVENFIRLVDREYYDDTVIHRSVEGPEFNVIEGGDPTGIGTGGETATRGVLVDEIWKVEPQYEIDENDPNRTSVLVNTPEFNDAGLYPGYSVETGQAIFPKGLIMMANTGTRDSATSRFFITTDRTVLPASYTVFGVVEDDESIAVLDKIKNETEPEVADDSLETRDGRPDEEVKINSIRII